MSKKSDRRKEQKQAEKEPSSQRRYEPKIPTEEDFARASRLMEERHRHLHEICEAVTRRFKTPWWGWFAKPSPFHSIYLFCDSTADFRAYVFFQKNKDIHDCGANGVRKLVEESVYDELERFGRGKRGDIVVAFEWDSDQNVRKQSNGDYFLHLR